MNLLFLCVANSARSQMAEGLAKEILPDNIKVQSAGSSPTKVNPFAVEAMSDIGIDISNQQSKSISDIDIKNVDVVITLCAEEVCPTVNFTTRTEHWPLPDPGQDANDPLEIMESFRLVRDELSNKISKFSVSLEN